MMDSTAATSETRRPLMLAAACAVLAIMCYVVFVRTTSGKVIDDDILQSTLRMAADTGAGTFTSWPLAIPASTLLLVAVVLVIGFGAAQQRWLDVSAALAILACATLLAHLLKSLLVRPQLLPGVDDAGNSFPSGHVSLAAASMLALAIVVPAVLRPTVLLLGWVWIGAVSVATVIAGWHRPSDAVGAIAVALASYGVLVALRNQARVVLAVREPAAVAELDRRPLAVR
ncbi:MAG: phosphatase PAP2 family protein [Jatrophihabitans sp.]